MPIPIHPNEALFNGERALPAIAPCEHFAGSRKLIEKAFALQEQHGPVFDITCDCEDGAAAGQEPEHAAMVAELIASPLNRWRQAGVRIHDPAHPHVLADIDILLERAGAEVAYITIPKATCAADVARVLAHIEARREDLEIERRIPIHVLIETHGALADVWEIAALPGLEVLDFGLMDFVSGHHGAIPAAAMRSPGQFEHQLLARAKAEVVAAALANGIVPAHNVCLDLKSPEQVFADASRARNEFGFLRMWSIYPTQIAPIVEAMRPAYDEVETAADILLSASAAQWGPIQHGGELHDRATYRYFWNLLQRANAAGTTISPAARTAFFAHA